MTRTRSSLLVLCTVLTAATVACGGGDKSASPEDEISRVNVAWQTEDDLRSQLCEHFREVSVEPIDSDAPPSAAQVELMRLADATSTQAVTRLAVLMSANC